MAWSTRYPKRQRVSMIVVGPLSVAVAGARKPKRSSRRALKYVASFTSDLIYYGGADESRMRKDLADIPKSNRALPLASVYFKLRSTYA